jgi:hypothetical protein
MYKHYFKYLKDNPNHYWFKNKMYGFGWVPVMWQGWLTLAIFLIFVIWQAIVFGATANDSADAILFISNIFLSIAVMFLICHIKGEKLTWRWGLSKEEKIKYQNPDK